MLRSTAIAALLALAAPGASAAGRTGPAPDDRRPTVGAERTGVHLVLVDAVVVDRAGRPHGDLGLDDFEVIVDHRIRTLSSVDVHCDDAPAEVPAAGSPGDAATVAPDRPPPPPRRLAIALDYQHLDEFRRAAVLERLRDELPELVGPGDEVMVAALTGGVRIEQAFTDDLDAVRASLDRMAHDISLWAPDFRHLTEEGFTSGLSALFDVLERVPGPKAVALYSTMQDVPLDLEFARLAADAATSRCAVYAVDAAGLLTPLDEEQSRGARPG